MTYAIAKISHYPASWGIGPGIEQSRRYVSSLSRVGDIRDTEVCTTDPITRVPPEPRRARTWAKLAGAESTLELMRGRGYDDYEIVKLPVAV